MPLLTKDDLKGVPFAQTALRLLGVEKVNRIYDSLADKRGVDFTSSFLEKIGVSYSVENSEILDNLPDGPFVTVSNHPFGSIDGLILIDLIARRYPGFRVMANRYLMRIGSLDDVFIPVTPVGKDSPNPFENVSGLKEVIRTIRSGQPVGFFPAGAISGTSGIGPRAVLKDRPWQESIVKLIEKLAVPVVPVQFLDRNSRFFYFLEHLDWRVRLARLPRELLNKSGRTLRVKIAEECSAEDLPRIEASFEMKL